MHWQDRIVAQAIRLPRIYPRIFADGWGPVDDVVGIDPGATLPSVYRAQPKNGHFSDLRFLSPNAAYLPHYSRFGYARVFRPTRTRRLVILFPAFNDHGYVTRQRLAEELAGEGIASAIIEGPLYGRRRPCPGQVVRTVADLLTMGSTVVTEALALARWLESVGWIVGLSGYSMGGSMAALAAAWSPHPRAVAPLAAADSPREVYVDAVLSHAVAWEALGDGARGRLADVLGRAATTARPALPHGRTAVLVAAEQDGYVPLSATRRIADHWPGAELRVVTGGHASLHRRRAIHVAAIKDAFDRFSAW